MSQGNMPEPDRYAVEHLETVDNFDATLQEQLNEGSKSSWQLVGVVQDPTGNGVMLIWDTEGMISG